MQIRKMRLLPVSVQMRICKSLVFSQAVASHEESLSRDDIQMDPVRSANIKLDVPAILE